jgi:hypothetical protein
MNLNECLNRATKSATDAEFSKALQTLQAHIRYREELKEYDAQGGRLSRPLWAESGRKRRRGHMSF